MRIDFNTLYALIDKCCIRVSFGGLMKDYPVAFTAFDEITKREQWYDLLIDGFPDALKELDKLFIFFIKHKEENNRKIIQVVNFLKKDWYLKEEYEAIARNAEVDIAEIEAIIYERQK